MKHVPWIPSPAYKRCSSWTYAGSGKWMTWWSASTLSARRPQDDGSSYLGLRWVFSQETHMIPHSYPVKYPRFTGQILTIKTRPLSVKIGNCAILWCSLVVEDITNWNDKRWVFRCEGNRERLLNKMWNLKIKQLWLLVIHRIWWEAARRLRVYGNVYYI